MKKLGLRGKLSLLFLVMTVLLLLGIGLTDYNLARSQMEEQYSRIATSAGQMAAALIPAERVEGYLADGADDEYVRVYQQLQALKKNFSLAYLYVSVPVEGENDTIYVFDVSLEGESTDMIGQLGDRTGAVDVYDIVSGLYRTGREGDAVTIITSSEYGYLASAYVPLLGADGQPVAVVGADISMDRILSEVRDDAMSTMAITVFIVLAFMVVLLCATGRAVIRPAQRLAAHMEQFVGGDGAPMEEFHLHTGDELEAMANSFNKMVADLKLYTQNLAKVTAEHQRVETELNVATQIQTSMLPSTFPPFPHRPEIDLYASMIPAKEVGGDFYDFFMLDDNRIGVVIADVSGKGVPAALFMVIAKILLKDQAFHASSPREIMMAVNDKLCNNNEAGFFVTAFIGILELSTGQFSYANAGHNPPLLMRDGAYAYMQVKRSLVLAGMEGYSYKTEGIDLRPGDRLLLYTDGVTEAMNPENELYGEERLLADLNEAGGKVPSARETVALVNERVRRFSNGEEQADDITVLSLIYRG